MIQSDGVPAALPRSHTLLCTPQQERTPTGPLLTHLSSTSTLILAENVFHSLLSNLNRSENVESMGAYILSDLKILTAGF